MDTSTLKPIDGAGIFHLTPDLPPKVCGVGDYATILAQDLASQHTIASNLVAFTNCNSYSPAVADFPATSSPPNSRAMLDAFQDDCRCLILHYAGFGYQKRGCPFWLLRALTSLKEKQPELTLITMFHETYGQGKPWNSSFWSRPLQESICRQIADLSNSVITNRSISQAFLQRSQSKPIHLLPVFSNVGEPPSLPPFQNRKRRLILFGGTTQRRLALENNLEEIRELCRTYQIEECLEIGPGRTSCPTGLPWKQAGTLPAEEISKILESSMFGYVSYPSHSLEKSGIFAAYVAHGVIPCIPASNEQSPFDGDTLCLRPHSELTPLPAAELETTSKMTFEWYQSHSVSSHGNLFAHEIRSHLR